MKLKKVLVAILIIVIILTLEASYLFTGTPQSQIEPESMQQSAPSTFTGPTSAPSVRGPNPGVSQ